MHPVYRCSSPSEWVVGWFWGCGLLAWFAAVGVLAGPVETTTAAVLPLPFYRLSAERTNLVFREGEKIEIRVEPVSNAPAGQRLTLWGEDAWGRTVFERSVSAPAPGESRRLRIDADGRRYLRLRLTPRAEPAATNALLSLVVIPPPAAVPDPRFGFNTAPRLSTPFPWARGAPWASQPVG